MFDRLPLPRVGEFPHFLSAYRKYERQATLLTLSDQRGTNGRGVFACPILDVPGAQSAAHECCRVRPRRYRYVLSACLRRPILLAML